MIDCAMARMPEARLRELAERRCERTPDGGPGDCAAVDDGSVHVLGCHMKPSEWCEPCRARRMLGEEGA